MSVPTSIGADAPHYSPGDVFQINQQHGRAGWVGSFVLAEEIKSWGIQGFVVAIQTHDKQERAYIRLTWKEIDYIGHAVLTPADFSQACPHEKLHGGYCEDCGELIDENAAAEAAEQRRIDDGETYRGGEAASALAEEQAWIQRNLK